MNLELGLANLHKKASAKILDLRRLAARPKILVEQLEALFANCNGPGFDGRDRNFRENCYEHVSQYLLFILSCLIALHKEGEAPNDVCLDAT